MIWKIVAKFAELRVNFMVCNHENEMLLCLRHISLKCNNLKSFE